MLYTMRFIDLHCHLLPGIDDGSTIVETVEMLRIAISEEHEASWPRLTLSANVLFSQLGCTV